VLPRPPPTPAQIAAARESLGVAAADFVIGSVARLDPEKGHGGLIEAFLRAGLPGAKLVIIGSGGLRAVLRAQAQEAGGQVILADFRPDVRDLYPAFDLFVLNSTVEQLPLALLEALDAGVPAIATATDGAREIAAHLPLRLVPIGDTAALVQALQEGRAGRLPASPEGAGPYRLDAMLPRIVAAYEQVIVHHTAGRRPGGLLGYSLRA
jgi:glycosyltransferase involved in cell wall biosynthesis